MKKQDLIALAGSVVLTLGVGFVGSLFTAPAIQGWYTTLVRPELAPPNWVFGPVWTTLYVMMAVAAFLVWQRKDALFSKKKVALGLYALQLGLNTAWSYFFFGQQEIGFALGVIAALWLMIALTMYWFYKISKPAAYLLVPYLLWVSFASYLNYQFWLLN